MNQSPTVVVRKGGFLSALAIGLFTFLTGAVVCASAVAFYGLHIVDNRSGDVVSTVQTIVAALPEWRRALPPAVSEALQDERDPSYREELTVAARIVPASGRSDASTAIIEVTNNGERTVSLLALRVALEDGSGVPLESFSTYVATPLAIGDDDWRGPLLPGSTRRISEGRWVSGRAARATVEVNELRVWVETPKTTPETTTAPQAAQAP
jgi:hypothetical protein